MRNRVTITIKDDLLLQVDRLVDGLTIRSRSQAIEYLLSKFLSDFRLKKVLVLAGGKDNRMLSLTKNQPKFLLDVKGKTILERVLEQINSFHVSNFYIYLDCFHEAIKTSFAKKKLPYEIEFIEAEKPLGTVEPLLRAKHKLNDTFLVAYGDTITSLNLNEMLLFHKKNKALATMALTTVSNPREFGVVMLQGNKIEEFIQKPKKEVSSYLINSGYCLFEPEIFKFISRKMKSLEKDLFPRLAKRGLLYGYAFQGIYLNINTKNDLEKARAIL